MGYGTPGRSEHEHEADLGYLRAKARSAYRSYQETRYDATGSILPGLIRGAEMADRAAGWAAQRPARCASSSMTPQRRS